MTSDIDLDTLFMGLVYQVAMKSKDNRTHIGAVVVGPDNEIRSVGYNSFVRGLNDNVPERNVAPEKYYWFEHAERNAIYNATLMGVSLKDCRLYTNGVPCMDCARGVIQSGIKEVIVDKQWEDLKDEKGDSKWDEHFKRSIEMFDEVGVKVRFFNGRLPIIYKLRKGIKLDLCLDLCGNNKVSKGE